MEEYRFLRVTAPGLDEFRAAAAEAFAVNV